MGNRIKAAFLESLLFGELGYGLSFLALVGMTIGAVALIVLMLQALMELNP